MVLSIFSKIHQWSHLGPGFCVHRQVGGGEILHLLIQIHVPGLSKISGTARVIFDSLTVFSMNLSVSSSKFNVLA